jgi:hypothetical protein
MKYFSCPIIILKVSENRKHGVKDALKKVL